MRLKLRRRRFGQLVIVSAVAATPIYMVLIAYLILDLMEIPAFYGHQLLDKFRYLQLELSRRCSLIHWSYDLLPETLV